MIKIFGITNSPMLAFMQIMRKRYGKRCGLIEDYKNNPDNYDLVISASANEAMPLNKTKIRPVLVIFDSPLVLSQVRRLEMLDLTPQNDLLGYKLTPQSVDYDKLFKAIRRNRRQPKPQKLLIEKKDLLEDIIQASTQSGFLNLFNTFLYTIKNTSERAKVRNLLVSFIFTPTSDKKLLEHIANQTVIKDKQATALQAIINYMHSEAGGILRTALHEVASAKRAPYKSVAKKYSISPFELQNLFLLKQGKVQSNKHLS